MIIIIFVTSRLEMSKTIIILSLNKYYVGLIHSYHVLNSLFIHTLSFDNDSVVLEDRMGTGPCNPSMQKGETLNFRCGCVSFVRTTPISSCCRGVCGTVSGVQSALFRMMRKNIYFVSLQPGTSLVNVGLVLSLLLLRNVVLNAQGKRSVAKL